MNTFGLFSSISLPLDWPQGSPRQAHRVLGGLAVIFWIFAPVTVHADIANRSSLIAAMLEQHRIECFSAKYKATATVQAVMPLTFGFHCTDDSINSDMTWIKNRDASSGAWNEPLRLTQPLNLMSQLKLTALSSNELSTAALASTWIGAKSPSTLASGR